MIYAGDLNVAHQEIDLKMRRPTVAMRASLMKREPAFRRVLENGFIDTFRYFYPGPDRGVIPGGLYMFQARAKMPDGELLFRGIGVSERSGWRMRRSTRKFPGSDQCPIELDLK